MFLMVCEFDDLRMWLQRLERQSRGRERLNKEVMRKMELEAKSMTNDGKAKVVLKLGAYGNDVKKLKNELENFVQVVLFKLWCIKNIMLEDFKWYDKED
ncbi:vesicle transport v-SNARE 11 [Tanacetum coccineum]